ncbi:serine/threonine-protein kinase [Nannocystis punicea]|uniref:Serine/threonine-protein kinase n=1 Tax=Nannocystis punicea TaxID=2995304 RepID=A0ABY7H5J8_9BACT|nr:serine/threonine-protein kinase [Nannocystis poenicansa]WAS94345.1 serine/threonine-protein kinase [Nannocystis poenicansa]
MDPTPHSHEPAPGESSGVIKIPSLAQEADPASRSGTGYAKVVEPEDPDDLVERVLGNYRLVRPLGGRGLSTVYEARAAAGGDRRFAVKILRNANFNRGALDVVQRRFVQEARVASRLHHPHIGDVVDFGIEGGLAYIVMEYLEGESLRETLSRHGPLPWTRVLPMFLHICDALEAAHAQGVIHRDLKPSNVYRVRHATSDDYVKVVDFGLARIVDEDLPEGLLAGGVLLSTPEYMAPELIRGAKPDPRVDIYAVGVLLYELLTGSCPFKSGKQTTVLAMQLLDTPIPPRRVAPDANIPGVVERVILKALSKAPEERYQNIMELRLALLDDTRIGRAEASAIRTKALSGPSRSASSASAPVKESSVGVTIVLALIAAGLIAWVFAGTPGLEYLTGAPPPGPPPVAAPAAAALPPDAQPPAATDPRVLETTPPVPTQDPPIEAADPEDPPPPPEPEPTVALPSMPPDPLPPNDPEPTAIKAARTTRSSETGPKEQVNYDIVEDPDEATAVSEAQIDELLKPYRTGAAQCGRQNGVAVDATVTFKFMLTKDGRLAQIKPVGRAATDPAAVCMIALFRDARLPVPAGSSFKHAFFDYSFRVY